MFVEWFLQGTLGGAIKSPINTGIGRGAFENYTGLFSGMTDGGIPANGVVPEMAHFFVSIGFGIIALIFLMEVIGKSLEVKRFTFESLVSMLFRLMVAKLLVENALTVMIAIDTIISKFCAGIVGTVNYSATWALNDISWLD